MRVLTCSACGHDLYPLHFTLAAHPVRRAGPVRCRVAVPAGFGEESHACDCEASAHSEA